MYLSSKDLATGISNWIWLKMHHIFWLGFEYFSAYLDRKCRTYLHLRRCFNMIVMEVGNMETESGLLTLWLVSVGSRDSLSARGCLGEQWPQYLHSFLESNHPAFNQLTLFRIAYVSNPEVCINNLRGSSKTARVAQSHDWKSQSERGWE